MTVASCEKEVITPEHLDTDSDAHYRGSDDVNGSDDSRFSTGLDRDRGGEDGGDGDGDDGITDPDEDEDFDEDGQGITDPDEDEDFGEQEKGK